MSILLNYIWRAWMLVLAILLTTVLFLPVYLLSFQKKHYKYAYPFVRAWCFGMFYGMGFRYHFVQETTKKFDPKTPYVIIANHGSMVDIFLPVLLFPKHPICFVGKKELVNIPIFGSIYKRICVMVDRGSIKSRAEVYQRCAERMREGDSIVIFPEGGVSDDPTMVLDHFKDGAFVLSKEHNFPLVVLSFIGPKVMFPFAYGKGFPGTIKVILNDIIDPSENKEELKKRSYDLIKQTLDKYS